MRTRPKAVVALVGSGATSGQARILQNGVMSNGVPFTVNTLTISSVSPSAANPGASSVTITGTGLGASQGSGTVLLGSVNGLVVSWSDTQIVAAVASNSVTGVARVQQNGAWSKGVSFSVIGGTVTLTPNLINLAVGETQPIQARGSNGQPVTGLTLEFR